MAWYCVNYSVNRNYDVMIEAASEEEAEQLVKEGSFNEDKAEVIGEEFLNVNNIELICENNVPCYHIKHIQGFGEAHKCDLDDEQVSPDECNSERGCYEPDFN